MAKARIGHFVEAQILEALEVDYIDESEVLTPADTANHIDKWRFTVPFVCGCTNLGRGAPPHRRRRRDDPHQGRGRHRRHRQRRHAHARRLRLDQEAGRDARGGALLRGEGAARADRAREVGRREREAAGRHVHGRRDRDSRRRRALHAARRGRRLRRLGDLQVDEPVGAGEGDRRGDDALRGRRRPRARLAGPGRRDDGPLGGRASRPKSCSRPAAGNSEPVRPARASQLAT